MDLENEESGVFIRWLDEINHGRSMLMDQGVFETTRAGFVGRTNITVDSWNERMYLSNINELVAIVLRHRDYL